MVAEAEANAAEDEKRREAINVKNQADQLIYQTEKTLKETENIPEDIASNVQNRVDALKEAVASEDVAQMQQLMGEVQQAAMAIGEAMYANGADGSADGGATDDDNVVDGEFEAA